MIWIKDGIYDEITVQFVGDVVIVVTDRVALVEIDVDQCMGLM